MPTLAAPLDCAKLETRNERIHQLSTAPSSPVSGQCYYNTTDNTFYWWNGTAWRSADASAGVGGPPTGSAGGDLAGSTYPNPIIAALAVTDAKVATANKDGAVGTPSMRTLGSGAAQACAGNDARLSDARAPTGAAGGDLTGSTYPNPVVAALAITDAKVATANKDGAAGTACMRTLGSTAGTAAPGNRTLDAEPKAVASLDINSQKIINLATPTTATDAATKGYVDASAQGLDVKNSCRVASTVNLSVAAPGATIDGVTMVSGDRMLLKDQTTTTENGIYLWNGAATPATRATDADTSAEVTPGMFTFIEEGTVNADSGWVLTTNAPITIGSTGLAFSQFSGAGQITAGTGMIKTGNTLDVQGTAGRITANADTMDIAATYVGQTSITTLGTVTSGTWNGSPVGLTWGGTGQSTAKAARETGLSAAGYYSSATHGAGASIAITQATHGLRASTGLLVQCQIESTGAVIMPDVSVSSGGDVTVTFAVSQSANTIRVTIIG